MRWPLVGWLLVGWLLVAPVLPAAAFPLAIHPASLGRILDETTLGAMIVGSVSSAIAGAASGERAQASWMRALVAGDYPAAVRELEAALRGRPKDPDLLYYLGLARNALGQYALAIPVLARARALEPGEPDVRLQLSLARIALNRWAEARPDLEWLWAREPKTENLGFYLGHALYMAGEHARAIPVLRANVSREARYAQLAQYYLALAQQRSGNAAAAREALSQATRLVPGSPLANQAEQNLNQVQVAAQKRRFQLDARAAAQYDDNVRFAPVSNVFGLRDQRLDSSGTLLFVRPQWIAVRAPASELTLSYSGSFTHNVSIPELDVDSHQLSGVVTARRRWRGRTITGGASLTGDHTRLGDEPFLTRFLVTPFVTVPVSPGAITSAFLQLSRREFEVPFAIAPDDNRSSVLALAGVNHFQLYRGGRHYWKAGVLVDRDEAEGRNFRYDGVRPLVGLYTSTSQGLSLTLDAQRHERRYAGVNSTFGMRRRDTEEVFSARLAQYWQRPGVSLVLDGLFTETASTIPLFTFRRNVTTLGVSYRY